MTPTQKQIVKDRARLDAEKVISLLELFLRKSGHLGYKHVMPPTDCPQPTIILRGHYEQDQNVENSHEPQSDTGIYGTQQKFVKAMLDRTMPTLIVSGTSSNFNVPQPHTPNSYAYAYASSKI